MTNIDIDLDGMDRLNTQLQELEGDWEDEPIYAVGSNVEYGVYLEFGTEDMPPYSWFRPAVREFERDPEGFIVDTTGYPSIDAIPDTQSLVEAVAAGLEGRMTDNVNAQKASADRSPGTHPEHPKRDTGNLTASIQAVRLE